MTEHLLYGTEVGAALKQMCGKRMPQGMRTDRTCYPRQRCQFLYYIEYHDPREMCAAAAQKQILLLAGLYIYGRTLRQLSLIHISEPTRR